jgi:hypothetical protein
MKELPLACSLDAAGMAAQRGRYAEVARHVVALTRREQALEAELDEGADGALLYELIAVEHECCPFFSLSYDGVARKLSVSVASDDHVSALDAIAHSLRSD